jgi:hypothetical protein
MIDKIWKWLKKLNAKINKLNGQYHQCSLKIYMIDDTSIPVVQLSCWKRYELKTHKITSYFISNNKIDSYDSTPNILKTRMSKWYAN